MVLSDDFINVQQVLEIKSAGYQHKKNVEERPLTRSLRCNCCGFLWGLQEQQENLHYYRCLKCNGVSLNAHSTPHATKKSAEALFNELLDQYQMPKKRVFTMMQKTTNIEPGIQTNLLN